MQLKITRRYIRKLRENKEIDESLVDILESVYDKNIFTMTIIKYIEKVNKLKNRSLCQTGKIKYQRHHIIPKSLYKNEILELPQKGIETIKVTKQEHKKLHNLLIDCSKNRDIALLVKGCGDYKNIARHKKWYKNQKIENTN